MHVEVDQLKCVGSGQCVLLVPEVFDQDDDGIVELLDADPSPDYHDDVRESAAICPATAIRLAPR
ncbi:ferredoxin [Streptomyces sp. SID11385]|uniref:ferredoxin n=1 Tax=Streptomyces sp. SID11385 TaxID=2706031 RepID=UPI0013CAF8BD|nr:ferredoxin [Streptomyces sp. SID11385]NEA40186.1 ferredoxin [Streptomyces sp. SID11385]